MVKYQPVQQGRTHSSSQYIPTHISTDTAPGVLPCSIVTTLDVSIELKGCPPLIYDKIRP